MSVGKITSSSELDAALSKAGGALVVVDFSASWCAPCRRLEPLFEEMARKHSPAGVKFYKVMEDDAKDLIAEQRIGAFPTIRFFVKKAMVDEVRGADPDGIEARIEKHKGSAVASFAGAGASLGGKSASSAEEMRLARMRALRGGDGAGSAAAAPAAPAASSAVSAAAARALAAAEHGDDDADASLAAALAASRASASASAAAAPRAAPAASASGAGSGSGSGFVPRADLLSQLVAMEMSRERSYRALQATGNASVESAVDWLFTHGEEAGLDDPIPGFTAAPAAAHAPAPAADAHPAAAHDAHAASGGAGAPAASSSSSAAASAVASRPDLSDADRQAIADAERLLDAENRASEASGSDAPPRKMTPAEVDALLKKRREERAAKEKEDARLAEIRRREEGAKSVEMAEQIAAMQRKAAADKLVREKEATEAERRRLQVELLRDKIERHSRLHGTVPRELMDQLVALENMKSGAGAAGGAGAAADPSSNPTGSAKVALAAMGALGARGSVCAQTVRTLCNNALTHPEEAKYRTVSLANDKIKERLGSVPGGLHAMLAAGWVKDEEAKTLNMPDPAAKADKLRAVIAELDAALAAGAFKEY